MVANLQLIKDEIVNDPLARGYSGMTDAQVAADLATTYRTKNKPTLSASEIFESIDLTEYSALAAAEKGRVDVVLNLGDEIKIGPTSKARAFLAGAFGAGTATRTALIAAATESLSRATELGINPSDYGLTTLEQVVTAARALP